MMSTRLGYQVKNVKISWTLVNSLNPYDSCSVHFYSPEGLSGPGRDSSGAKDASGSGSSGGSAELNFGRRCSDAAAARWAGRRSGAAAA